MTKVSHKNLGLLFGLTLLCVFLFAGLVSAWVEPNPFPGNRNPWNPAGGQFGSNHTIPYRYMSSPLNDIPTCDDPSLYAANRLNFFGTWISEAIWPPSEPEWVENVQAGTLTLGLWYNMLMTNCHNQSATGGVHIVETVNTITGVSSNPTGVIGTIGVGSQLGVGVTNGQNKGAFNQSQHYFTYSPSGGFLRDGLYTISFNFKTTIRLSNGRYACVNNTGAVTYVPNHGAHSVCTLWSEIKPLLVDVIEPTCTISNIRRYSDNSTSIRSGDRIVFDVNVRNGRGLRLGANGPGRGPEFPGTNINNYLVTGNNYVRGPAISSNNFSTTVTTVGYNTDSGPFNQAINAPSATGNYVFDWGLVLPGYGWSATRCTGTVRVVPPPDVCANISGNQATVPVGYTQSGNNCLLNVPCSPQPATINTETGTQFTMQVRFTNPTNTNLVTTNLRYSGDLSRNPVGSSNPADIAASSSRTYSDSSPRQFNGAGTYTVTWRLQYNTLYGNDNSQCNVTIRVRNQQPTLHCSFPAGVNLEVGRGSQPITMTIYYTGGASTGTLSNISITVSPDGVGRSFANINNMARGVNNSRDFTYEYTPTTDGNKTVIGTARIVTSDGLGGTLSDELTQQECSEDIDVGQRPYLKVFGGDVRAGGVFNSGMTCPDAGADPIGGIYTYADPPTDGGYRGSSSQFTITALLSINENYSASQRAGSPNPPKGLTLANNGSTAADSQYGGGYGGNERAACITDYYGTTAVDLTDPERPVVVNPNSLNPFSSGSLTANMGTIQRYLPGSQTIGGFQVPVGTQVAVYVGGDLFINDDITFSTAARTSPEDIPNFQLIVRGNIYISPGVRQLDGLYIAQPVDDSSGGTIYTCAPGVSATYTATNLYDSCQTQLIINGAVVAKRVKFLRVHSSLINASTGELFASTNAAEVINYNPEMYIAPSAMAEVGDPNLSVNDTESIISLPPVW